MSFASVRLEADDLTDLLEIALEKEVTQYGLGFRPVCEWGGIDGIIALEFYRIVDDPDRVSARTSRKSSHRKSLADAGLL